MRATICSTVELATICSPAVPGLDILNGGDGNDELQGYFEAGDVLDGGAGDDKLFDYSSGATTLRGGVGDDKLYSSWRRRR